jgi:CubicO group peptidase (beta-lactamase class C family)
MWRIDHRVGVFSHFDAMGEAHLVPRAGTPSPFARAPIAAEFRYRYDNRDYTLAEFLERNPVTGLLIIKDGTILSEHYQYVRTEKDRFTSFSMAKTINAMLIGIALQERRIASIDDLAETYVPGLKGTPYGATSIRDLLHMSSGVEYREVYDGHDDAAIFSRYTWQQEGPGTLDGVKLFGNRTAPPGTRFHYASIESDVLGMVLTAATGRSAAEYLHDKIWAPIGAEADATWLVDRRGQETTSCCLQAVLRDFGRVGRLLANDGAWQGREIIPRQWLLDATTITRPQDANLAPGFKGRVLGYGYQTWIYPGEPRSFALIGVYGQRISVAPDAKLVMVQTSVRTNPIGNDENDRESAALWQALRLADRAGTLMAKP